MDLKKRRKVIRILIPVSLITILTVVFTTTVLLQKQEKKEISRLDYKEVEKIYQNVTPDNCTDIIDNEEKTMLFLIFGQMKRDKILSESISQKTFELETKKILNSDTNINVSGYTYEGYTYTSNGSEITRQKADCSSKSYVSKLYGYSIDNDNLYLAITSGYVENGIVYDLSGNEIGEYNKQTLMKSLDKGTMTKYQYTNTNGSYKFEKIDE